MKNQNVPISLRWLFTAAVIVALTISLLPIREVHADGITTTSDLVVELISVPKHVKACQVFEVTYKVTNLGPDPATHLYMGVGMTDHFDPVGTRGVPDTLAVGETVTITSAILVSAFVPGETRNAWVSPGAISDPYPDISVDPNPDNNYVDRTIKLISKPVLTCWP